MGARGAGSLDPLVDPHSDLSSFWEHFLQDFEHESFDDLVSQMMEC